MMEDDIDSIFYWASKWAIRALFVCLLFTKGFVILDDLRKILGANSLPLPPKK